MSAIPAYTWYKAVQRNAGKQREVTRFSCSFLSGFVPRLDFCTLGHHFSPFHKGFQDFSRRRIQSGVFKNPFPPCGVSQSSKKVLERCGVFLLVPKPPQSGRTN